MEATMELPTVTQNFREMSISPPLSMDLLPNEILKLIINDVDIPLQERIKFRAVSTRWLAVIEDDLKKETVITIREPDDDRYTITKRTELVVPNTDYFNAKLAILLARLFPSAELIVKIRSEEYYRYLPEVLRVFTNLKNFTLSGKYTLRKCLPSIGEIAWVLNSFTNLTHLCLAVCDTEAPIRIYLVSELGPTLARLEHFSMKDPYKVNYKHSPKTMQSMESLSDRCTSLCLNQAFFEPSRRSKFASSLTRLHLSDATQYGIRLCRNLTALTSLSVNFAKNFGHPPYLNTDLMRTLSDLKQLTELDMGSLKYWNEVSNRYDFRNLIDFRNRHDFGYNPVKRLDPPSDTDHPLVNLKKLHLTAHYRCVFECTHGCKSLVAWCPNLVELNIKCGIWEHGKYEANRDVFSSDTVVSIKPILS